MDKYILLVCRSALSAAWFCTAQGNRANQSSRYSLFSVYHSIFQRLWSVGSHLSLGKIFFFLGTRAVLLVQQLSFWSWLLAFWFGLFGTCCVSPCGGTWVIVLVREKNHAKHWGLCVLSTSRFTANLFFFYTVHPLNKWPWEVLECLLEHWVCTFLLRQKLADNCLSKCSPFTPYLTPFVVPSLKPKHFPCPLAVGCSRFYSPLSNDFV